MFREEERGKRIKHIITTQSYQQSPKNEGYIKLILIICFYFSPRVFWNQSKVAKENTMFSFLCSIFWEKVLINSIKDSQKDLLPHILICSSVMRLSLNKALLLLICNWDDWMSWGKKSFREKKEVNKLGR